MASRKVISEALAEFAALHRQPAPTKFVARLYESAVADWSDERFLEVCEIVSQKLKWFPKPADFIEHGGGSDSDAALEAWSRVVHAMKTVGRYRSIDFGPVANAAVRDIGGWVKLCEADEDELRHTQRHFLSAFAGAARVGPTAERSSILMGLEGLDAQRMGMDPPPPVLRLRPGEAPALPPPRHQPQQRRGEVVDITRLVGSVRSVDGGRS